MFDSSIALASVDPGGLTWYTGTQSFSCTAAVRLPDTLTLRLTFGGLGTLDPHTQGLDYDQSSGSLEGTSGLPVASFFLPLV